MKKLLFIVLIIFLLTLGLWYFFFQKKNKINTTNTTSITNITQTKLYKNQEANFTINVPRQINIQENPNNFDIGEASLSQVISVVIKTKKNTFFSKNPYDPTPEQMKIESDLLNNGILPPINDSSFVYEPSRKIVLLSGKKYAIKQMNFFGFDCDEFYFEQKLTTYNKGYHVNISYIANAEKIKKLYPEYFTRDFKCENKIVFSRSDQFYEDLVSGKLKGVAQEWYGTFNQMIRDITFD